MLAYSCIAHIGNPGLYIRHRPGFSTDFCLSLSDRSSKISSGEIHKLVLGRIDVVFDVRERQPRALAVVGLVLLYVASGRNIDPGAVLRHGELSRLADEADKGYILDAAGHSEASGHEAVRRYLL